MYFLTLILLFAIAFITILNSSRVWPLLPDVYKRQALEGAIEALENGDGDLAYDEYLSSVDYNWYAYDFEKEAYEFQLNRIRENAKGTWGEGRILRPGENLYDVIKFLGDNYGEENVDYSNVIKVLNESLERQYIFLDEITLEEKATIDRLSTKMEELLK